MQFEDLKLTRQYIRALVEAGITQPTAIQQKAIPSIRSGQDVIGIAQTGTGKTAAYLLPLLQILQQAKGNEARALILVPTKELAIQVGSHFDMLSTYTDLRKAVLYGGVGPSKQLEALNEGCDMIISTPGRFMELYLKGGMATKKLKHVVLDEADRMMDMGFYHQIKAIQEVLPRKRQNLLFSATFPEKVDRLSEEFLLFPNRIEITPQATPVETVEQSIYRLPNFPSKLNLLQRLLDDREEFQKVIIFTRTKETAVNIGKFLDRKDLGPVEMIHSNRAQNARLNAINRFRSEDVRILVTTDVSARGIDIPKVSHVINFNIPRNHHDYVHRIGRTGRAFQMGLAISFSDPSEKWHVKKIEKLMGQAISLIDPPADLEIPKTSKEEKLEQAREIDRQKKRDNPDYKGAFHEKKRKGSVRSGSTRNKFKSRKKKR